MSNSDMTPRGLNGWGEDDWKKFASTFGPVKDGEFQELHFTGAFGGREIALLAAVAKNYLPIQFVVATYGFSSMDMVARWGDDLRGGIKNSELDGLGINSIEFVESTMARMMSLLT